MLVLSKLYGRILKHNLSWNRNSRTEWNKIFYF